MDIVIVGAGEVGYHLADILSREEHRVSIIDRDPEQVRRVMEALDVQMLSGDGTRAEVHTQAGALQADIVVAVTESDHVNMLVCTTAKALGAKRILLRLRDIFQEYGSLVKKNVNLAQAITLEVSLFLHKRLYHTTFGRGCDKMIKMSA